MRLAGMAAKALSDSAFSQAASKIDHALLMIDGTCVGLRAEIADGSSHSGWAILAICVDDREMTVEALSDWYSAFVQLDILATLGMAVLLI